MLEVKKFRGETCRHCQGLGFVLSDRLGPRLRELRERRGILQKVMAQRLAIVPEELSRIESGKRRVMPAFLKAYRTALGHQGIP